MLGAVANPLPDSPANKLLFILKGADFQLTTDQPFTKMFNGTNYVITHVQAIRKTGGATVACAGGIYTGAGKTGNALVAAAQSWIGLSGAAKSVAAAVAAVATTDVQTATPILALSTGSTAAVTGDVHIYGFPLDL